MSQATHWKNQEEACSVKHVEHLKNLKDRVKSIFKKTSTTFKASCQNFKIKFKVQQLASGEEVELFET